MLQRLRELRAGHGHTCWWLGGGREPAVFIACGASTQAFLGIGGDCNVQNSREANPPRVGLGGCGRTTTSDSARRDQHRRCCSPSAGRGTPKEGRLGRSHRLARTALPGQQETTTRHAVSKRSGWPDARGTGARSTFPSPLGQEAQDGIDRSGAPK